MSHDEDAVSADGLTDEDPVEKLCGQRAVFEFSSSASSSASPVGVSERWSAR
jgi:hypothetical protein